MSDSKKKSITQRLDERRVAKEIPGLSKDAVTAVATKPNCVVWMIYYEKGNSQSFCLPENQEIRSVLPGLIATFKERHHISVELEAKVYPSFPTDRPPQLFKRNGNATPVILVYPVGKEEPQLSALADFRAAQLSADTTPPKQTTKKGDEEESSRTIQGKTGLEEVLSKYEERIKTILKEAAEDRAAWQEKEREAEQDRRALLEKAEQDRRALLEKAEQDRRALMKQVVEAQRLQNKILKRHLLNLARVEIHQKDPSLLHPEDIMLIERPGRVRREGDRAAHSGKPEKIAQAILLMPASTVRDSLARIFRFCFDCEVDIFFEEEEENKMSTAG